MSRDPRISPALLLVTSLVTLILIATETFVLVPLVLLIAMIPLMSGGRPSTVNDRRNAEILARARYEHNALMLGHDAIGLYGRFQPTPLDAMRPDLLPEHLRSSADTAAARGNARTTAPAPTTPAPTTGASAPTDRTALNDSTTSADSTATSGSTAPSGSPATSSNTATTPSAHDSVARDGRSVDGPIDSSAAGTDETPGWRATGARPEWIPSTRRSSSNPAHRERPDAEPA